MNYRVIAYPVKPEYLVVAILILRQKHEAEAVVLRERSPNGLNFSSKSFALSVRWLQPRTFRAILRIADLVDAICPRN